MSAPVRIASWPHWYAPNRYLELFYDALRTFDIEHVPDVPLDVAALTKARVDVLHLHWVYPYWRDSAGLALGQMLAVRRLQRLLARAQQQRIPVIWTVHNLEHHEGMQLGDRLGERLLHRAVDLRIFHSIWSESQALERYGPGRGTTLVMPHGNYDGALPRPAPAAQTRTLEQVPQDRRLLLCFGQVRPYKGFDVAVEAMRRLPSERYHLVIAGRALHPCAAALARAAAERDDISVCLEEITDQRLADLLAAADAVLLPYLRVTGSGALLTALTCGRGVITSNLPYFREVLEQEPDAAGLAAPGDPAALAQAIENYFELPLERRAGAARALADRYSWSRVVAPVAEWILEQTAPTLPTFSAGSRDRVAAAASPPVTEPAPPAPVSGSARRLQLF